MDGKNSNNSYLSLDEKNMVSINFHPHEEAKSGLSRGQAWFIVAAAFGWAALATFAAIFAVGPLALALESNDQLLNQNANLIIERDALKCEVEIYQALYHQYENTGAILSPDEYVCGEDSMPRHNSQIPPTKKDGGE